MLDSSAHSDSRSMGDLLDVRAAIRWSWVIWLVLLAIPFVVFLTVMWGANFDSARPLASNAWFIGSMVYLLVAVTASFFVRNYLFRDYYTGHAVSPTKYVQGMLAIWIALEIGGIISLAGCRVDHALLPNLIPAMIAFMFFITQFPNGRAMVRTLGDSQDPEVYKEPR